MLAFSQELVIKPTAKYFTGLEDQELALTTIAPMVVVGKPFLEAAVQDIPIELVSKGFHVTKDYLASSLVNRMEFAVAFEPIKVVATTAIVYPEQHLLARLPLILRCQELGYISF